jgi:hypothetical protein
VCGLARVGVLLVDRRPVYLEIVFVALVAAITLVVAARALRARRRRGR